ncbi:MAG: signal peptide peptidase SppA [Chitinophagaceae bacterium]|nr:signal peptide peptidase SppA [Chitinophagaceae bacterium]
MDNGITYSQRLVNRINNYPKITTLLLIFIVLGSFISVKNEFFFTNTDLSSNDDGSEYGQYCNVASLALRGEIVTYISAEETAVDGNSMVDKTSSETLVGLINEINNNNAIEAIYLEIDSGGGSPTAGEAIADALRSTSKPVYVLVKDIAASSAYLAATGADKIFASAFSSIGGIGITMSYLENAAQNQKEGINYITLSSGKFKDAGAPEKTLTQEEKNLFMRDIMLMHEEFVKQVARNRQLDINKVTQLADGSTMMAQQALENGLIDQIGSIEDITNEIQNEIGEEVVYCW